MDKLIYRIALDHHCQKAVKITDSILINTANGGKIECRDGEKVVIEADEKDHEKLKVSFQLSYRCVDKWDHYLRLVDHTEESRNDETITRLRAYPKINIIA